MSKNTYFDNNEPKKSNAIHPIWGGIGIVITILTPIISIASGLATIQLGKSQNWAFLVPLYGQVIFPNSFYQLPVIKNIATFLSGVPDLLPLVLFFVIYFLLFSSFFAFINAVLYRSFGPPRYTSLDAPAPRIKTKRYTR